jgi:hypothetical protein
MNSYPKDKFTYRPPFHYPEESKDITNNIEKDIPKSKKKPIIVNELKKIKDLLNK